MSIGKGDAKKARYWQQRLWVGVADDDAELINFIGGRCIAHGHKQRIPSPVSFHKLLELPLIIFGFLLRQKQLFWAVEYLRGNLLSARIDKRIFLNAGRFLRVSQHHRRRRFWL